ncbi:MAG: GNAT family N-acetyltransferase [Leadbetterella sp.]
MYSLRNATVGDVPAIFNLVKELAIFEKAPEEVSNTVEMMIADGFGENPVFGCILAEDTDKSIVGMSLYYIRYSTWKGKRLFLEDLIVTENHRGQGLGKKLFDATLQRSKEIDCTGMMWQVLDWNTPAIEFYNKYPTRMDDEWINCHIDF